MASYNLFDNDIGSVVQFGNSGMSASHSTGNTQVFFNTTMGLDVVGRIQLCNTVISLNKKPVYFDKINFIVNSFDRC